MHSHYVKCSWNWRNCIQQYSMCGAPCMHCVDRNLGCQSSNTSSGVPGAQVWLWNILELPWNSLVHSHWCLGLQNTFVSSGRPIPTQCVAPLPGGGSHRMACCYLCHYLAEPGLSEQNEAVGPAGVCVGVIFCQPKHKLLKMVKQLRKCTLGICLTSLD